MDRLERVRRASASSGVDALWVRSTDRYLNEYVPDAESTRVWLSGFTGSMGEALVTADRALLFVDGRYWLQAEREVSSAWQVVRVPHGRSIDDVATEHLTEMGAQTVGIEADRWTLAEAQALEEALGPDVRIERLDPSPVELARAETEAPPERAQPELRVVADARVGHTARERLAALFDGVSVPAVWIHRLDDIAYLSGLRGLDLPNQATFRSVGLATPEQLWVALEGEPPELDGLAPEVRLTSPDALWSRIGSLGPVGVDPRHTPCSVEAELHRRGAETERVELALDRLKSKKSDAELDVMREAFRRADRAVTRTIRWACEAVVRGERVSEADVAERIAESFAAEGARGPSFATIAGAGENGAIIHYGTPDPERLLVRGELMLVDCGAYFDEGYATDLTRTFLVGGPDDRGDERQRFLYTSVLKAAIAGMSARVPVGATGGQLDTIVRSALWADGLSYAHGTGHGVGINVHESPPRLAPSHGSTLEASQVFSIEPGVYLEGWGGIRIENLCTLVPSPDHEGFLDVRPLTFAPLDHRLIDPDRLTAREKAFLDAFGQRFEG